MTVSAQTWNDVTDGYITNPRYDNNDLSGWEGTGLGAVGQKENAEHYQKTYDTYQELSGLKAGSYRVSLQAFYRAGSAADDYNHYNSWNASEYAHAKLYAESSEGSYESPIALSASGASSVNLGGGTSTVGGRYFTPNNMEAAYYWFEAGYYKNSVEAEVGNDGKLRIGIRKTYTLNGDWTCIDNWKLEYYGTIIRASYVSLNKTTMSMALGDVQQLSATIAPNSAFFKTVTWSSSNPNVATVDKNGNVSAIATGTTTIKAAATDGSGKFGQCTVTVTNNPATAESVIINEIMSANVDMFVDPSWNYGGWIELFNPTSTNVSVANYWVSDDPNNLKKAKINVRGSGIAAHGFCTLWFEHATTTKDAEDNYVNTQIDMKLDCDGGTIYISDEDGNIVAQQDYPASMSRCSYARTTDGGSTWGYTAFPTPKASNGGSLFANTRLNAPEVDTEGKMFTNGFSFNVNIPAGTTLYYTTDGSAPSPSNGSASSTGRFSVDKTTVYRFCLYREGYLPSPVVTRSFIKKNHDYYLPVISVVTNPDNLYDKEIGVYVKGTNGMKGNGQDSKCNWNMDWERPVNMEFLVPDEDGEYNVMLNQECDFEICGGWTRAYGGGTTDGVYWPMKGSFRLKADKKYEHINSLDYAVFPNKPYNKYKVWQVRNGGNDTGARIKDAALNQIVIKSGFNVDAQDCQPAHVFFNGQYLGMLNIRESNNKHYGYSNYGIDTDDMDQFDLSNAQYNQKAGDDEAWLKLVGLSTQLASNGSEATYNEICKLLDIDEYCNYMALECYIGCGDWITNTNNVKGFRSKTDGKFHFVLFDTDSSFDRDNMISEAINTTGGANVDDLFRNMITYEPFRKQFITTYCIVNGSVLDPDRSSSIVYDLYNMIDPALRFEGNYSNTGLASTIRNAHNGSRINNLKKFFGLDNAYNMNISANVDAAHLMINGQEVPNAELSGSLFAPITLTAKAPAGYRFLGWMQDGYTANASKEKVFGESDNWYYYDGGSLDAVNWTSTTYNLAQFKSAKAPFGYASSTDKFMSRTANTKLNYGTDSKNKRPTYYFIHNFTLTQLPKDGESYVLTYKIDDGLRIHVNGTDIGGYHCNEGVKYADYSTTYEGDDPYEGSIVIPNKLLKVGKNVIAIDVHNTSASSSDIYFDAKLEKATQSYISKDETFCLSNIEGAGSYNIQAQFEEIGNSGKRYEMGGTPIRINEVSAGNDININDHWKKNDWIELYNTTDEDIDIAGMYLSDNSNKPQKYEISGGNTDVNTIIPAHGRKIIWCDGLESLTQLHAPFKLDNSDGASVSIQANDGSWADRMTYMFQERWKTYGRYPDGGNYECILGHPTIEKANQIATYDYVNDEPNMWNGEQLAITLALPAGWNWTSHNLAENVDKSRFTSFAQCLRSQNNELFYDEYLGWVGNVKTLNAGQGYKLQMKRDAEITLRGNLYDVTVPVNVQNGWNWIGVPLYNATAINVALAKYSASEGDVIVGFDAFATYEDGNWVGSLRSLTPGQAYLMKSNKDQQFCWNSLSNNNVKSRRYAAPVSETAVWTVDSHAYPNIMNIIASVAEDDVLALGSSSYIVGAFCGDECRGVGEMVDGKLYINVHGNGNETLAFRIVGEDGQCYTANESAVLKQQTLLGSNKTPFVLSISQTTEITSVEGNGNVQDITYYNIKGQRISKPNSGMYIQKTTYRDGRVISKKVCLETKD